MCRRLCQCLPFRPRWPHLHWIVLFLSHQHPSTQSMSYERRFLIRLSWFTREIRLRGKARNSLRNERNVSIWTFPSSVTVTATPMKRPARIFRLHPSETFHQHHRVLKSKSLFHRPRLKVSNWQIALPCRPLDEPPPFKSKLNGWSVSWLTFCVLINYLWCSTVDI